MCVCVSHNAAIGIKYDIVLCLFLHSAQCELYHWVDVLDRFDKILNEACENDQSTTDSGTQCIFMCPKLQDANVCLVYLAFVMLVASSLFRLSLSPSISLSLSLPLSLSLSLSLPLSLCVCVFL